MQQQGSVDWQALRALAQDLPEAPEDFERLSEAQQWAWARAHLSPQVFAAVEIAYQAELRAASAEQRMRQDAHSLGRPQRREPFCSSSLVLRPSRMGLALQSLFPNLYRRVVGA